MSMRERLDAFDQARAEMMVDVDGLRFVYGSRTEYRRLMKRKPWDAPIAAWIDALRPGETFYDIGANVGGFALRAARRGVRTVAIEPGAETFASLCRNVALNDLQATVTPIPVALAARTSLDLLHYRDLTAGAALHALGTPIDYRGQPFTPAASIPVLAFALDDLIGQFGLPPPTVLKVDVDGAEAQVIAGATRTLCAVREAWVEIVVVHQGDRRPERICAILADIGLQEAQRVDHEIPASGYPRIFDVRVVRHLK